eukprot:CAMPEP_0204616534 /NCGR_PEP_ID=MMETSP0717-20131115/3750_1 /ASSEMBLY_ACC=CAM_ASM_000666 /TAXON_ID=230516 /ORGANISM="Chaetoceros curvisetus" /LENGTH=179 /DNA_ID=CAMNT_0051629797 /DNA_START=243 /DNA_END=782 /DNA_ORIENTATION=-
MKNENVVQKFFTASVASALIFSSAAVAPIEAQALDFGTDNVIAARSGGRAGGRSSASTMRSPPPSQRSSSTTTVNNYRSTTVVAPASPAIIAPTPVIAAPVVVSPITPFGGVGYGALGAVSAIGNEFREIRQENEIQRGRAELQDAKMKQAMLEQRLNAMEQREQTTAAVNAAVAAAKQ